MKINPKIPDNYNKQTKTQKKDKEKESVDFTKIDQPVEAFLTPPCDVMLGILAGKTKDGTLKYEGQIGDKEINYTYKISKDGHIEINGSLGKIPLQEQGQLENNQINFEGKLGENQLNSSFIPAANGPINETKFNGKRVAQKVNFDIFNNTVEATGLFFDQEYSEKLKTHTDGKSILDTGNIGKAKINRLITRDNEGNLIAIGTVAGLYYHMKITALAEKG